MPKKKNTDETYLVINKGYRYILLINLITYIIFYTYTILFYILIDHLKLNCCCTNYITR